MMHFPANSAQIWTIKCYIVQIESQKLYYYLLQNLWIKCASLLNTVAKHVLCSLKLYLFINVPFFTCAALRTTLLYFHMTGNTYWSTVNLLIKIGCLVKECFSLKSSWFELVSKRRSTELILPLQ